jgi:outer membrane lipoprotein SlyB
MKKVLLSSLILSACATVWAQGASQSTPAAERSKSASHIAMCDHCGTVQEVRQEKRKGEGGAVGIVGGAVVGGLVGNQFGKGSGKDLATVGGAVAGGFAGNEVQKHVTSKQVWVTKVKMKDGSVRTFEQAAKPNWVAGSHVKVQDNKTLSRI